MVQMERIDENGFFAVLLPEKQVPDYRFEILGEDGKVKCGADPYNYEPQIPERLKTGAKLNGEEMDRVKEALTRFVREARHGDAD